MPDEYTVVDQERETAANPATQRVERGWRVYYQDRQTGVNGDVFVADSVYTPAGVKTLIMAQLERVRAVHAGEG